MYVTHIEDDEKTFYVARVNDIKKLQEELMKHAASCPELESVEKDINCLVEVKDDGAWYVQLGLIYVFECEAVDSAFEWLSEGTMGNQPLNMRQ